MEYCIMFNMEREHLCILDEWAKRSENYFHYCGLVGKPLEFLVGQSVYGFRGLVFIPSGETCILCDVYMCDGNEEGERLFQELTGYGRFFKNEVTLLLKVLIGSKIYYVDGLFERLFREMV